LFATIQERTDIGGNPKRLYALLVSGRRKGVYWTQDELAEMLGSCRRSVIRWVQRLIEAGLLIVTRYGRGMANGYQLLGLPDEVIAGRSPRNGSSRDRQSHPEVTGGHQGSAGYLIEEKKGVKNSYLSPPRDPNAYSQTRYGQLARR